jgi:hypothetical protein
MSLAHSTPEPSCVEVLANAGVGFKASGTRKVPTTATVVAIPSKPLRRGRRFPNGVDITLLS